MKSAPRVLVVEDDALLQMDLEDELHDRGYAVTCAASIEAAQKALDDAAPSVVVLDMHLRRKTTFDLATDLQRRGVPFFFLSGNDASALPPDLHSVTIVTKPMQIAQVVAQIDALTAL